METRQSRAGVSLPANGPRPPSRRARSRRRRRPSPPRRSGWSRRRRASQPPSRARGRRSSARPPAKARSRRRAPPRRVCAAATIPRLGAGRSAGSGEARRRLAPRESRRGRCRWSRAARAAGRPSLRSAGGSATRTASRPPRDRAAPPARGEALSGGRRSSRAGGSRAERLRLERPQHGEAARRGGVQRCARDMLDDLPPRSHGGLRDADLSTAGRVRETPFALPAAGLCDAILVAEAVEHRCGEAAPAEPLDGWQSRVIPAADEAALDEELELALRHERVRDVEARVLPRHGLVQPQGVQQPVVRPVDRLALPELEGAERVRDVLERVDDAVGVVVGRVDAPARGERRRGERARGGRGSRKESAGAWSVVPGGTKTLLSRPL